MRSCSKKTVARYSKKRARELKHDKFRDATMNAFDLLGNRLEGKGRTIIYAIAAVVALAVLISVWSWWSNRHTDEARRALGRAIEIAETPVTPSPSPGATTPSFPSERERAQKAADEFQKVADKYSDPYREIARYLAATNRLTIDRNRGMSELEALSKSSNSEIAARAKFALAQAREADRQYDAAAALYSELAKEKDSVVVPPDTANLRLASIYEKQGKKSEAVDILFRLVETARKAQGKDGKPAPQSAAAREAAQKLEKLDPSRFAQLPPEPLADNLSL